MRPTFAAMKAEPFFHGTWCCKRCLFFFLIAFVVRADLNWKDLAVKRLASPLKVSVGDNFEKLTMSVEEVVGKSDVVHESRFGALEYAGACCRFDDCLSETACPVDSAESDRESVVGQQRAPPLVQVVDQQARLGGRQQAARRHHGRRPRDVDGLDAQLAQQLDRGRRCAGFAAGRTNKMKSR